MDGVPEPRQIDHLCVGDDDDVSATSAVTPVGATLGNPRLATERQAPIAAASTLDVNPCPVGKRHGGSAYAEAATSG